MRWTWEGCGTGNEKYHHSYQNLALRQNNLRIRQLLAFANLVHLLDSVQRGRAHVQLIHLQHFILAGAAVADIVVALHPDRLTLSHVPAPGSPRGGIRSFGSGIYSSRVGSAKNLPNHNLRQSRNVFPRLPRRLTNWVLFHFSARQIGN